MLNAIRFGKAGKIDVGLNKSVSWLSLYQNREDLIMATVVERLTYIPASLLITLLREAAFPKNLLPRSLGDVVDVEFWPKLTRPSKITVTVEPDAIITFERGALIVEAKRFDISMHSAEQWASQWAAYHYDLVQTENPHAVAAEDVFLLALGGFQKGDRDGIIQLTKLAQQLLMETEVSTYPTIKVVACPWRDLCKVVQDQRIARAGIWDHSGLRFLLRDLEAAFDLHGFRTMRWLADLVTERLPRPERELFTDLELLGFPRPKRGLPHIGPWQSLLQLAAIEVSKKELQCLMISH